MNQDEFKRAPAHLQIRESIYNKIISGEYKAGQKLPAEDKMAEQFGVSRMTVNKALMELVNREYLTRIQGSGTFVSKMRKEGSKSAKMSFNDSLTQKGFQVETIVLEKKMIPAGREAAESLNIPLTSSIMYLKRLRKVHNEPIVLQEAYLTSSVSGILMDIDFTTQSLYASLKKYCDTDIVRAKDMVEAKGAGKEICELLEVEENYPVLCTRRIAYAAGDMPVELSFSVYRSDQYVLEVEYR